jgi:4-hydroxy-3-methylbut-2-enyl diphosphate reductase
MKKFDIPNFYKSSIVSRIKELRRSGDPRKQNYEPTELDFGPIKILLARHFGFCYGVENAIEIAYKTIEENPDKKIFLLSEMIHNPLVNLDLQSRGVRFVMDNLGNQLIEWEKIQPEDIVVIPAFGTTIEIENLLSKKGIDIVKYNTTCPFVEKVWNRAETLGNENYTVMIHGKAKHEETRATFSHSRRNSPAVIIRDIEEAKVVAGIISGKMESDRFFELFDGKYTVGFDPKKDLNRIGVVNQTTMLASETQLIADLLKETMNEKFGEQNSKEHFADTRDTLCYATNDNQQATINLVQKEADFAIVIGGYNSSNTSHLVELLEEKFRTYFISDSDKIISKELIHHFDLHSKKEVITENYLPGKSQITIAITSGASCPDVVVDEVLTKLLFYFKDAKELNKVLGSLSV